MAAAIRVWDAFIRSYHWLIVAVFIANYFILEPGETVHQWLGYTAAGLVIARLIWAIVGPENAGISYFLPTPERLARHFSHLKNRQTPLKERHNPVGGLLILAFWLLFLGQGVTGFLLEETDRFFGSSRVENIHGLIADSLFVGAIIHVTAVIVMSWWGRIQLIRPMISGKRRPKG